MLRRLVVTGVAALVCLFLLFLENKCSYFLGNQELVAEVKPVDPAADPAKPRRYEVVLKDVAGNVLPTTPADVEAVAKRLAGNPARDQKPLATIGAPVDQGVKIVFEVEPTVAEADLRGRLQTVGFKRANPQKGLFHLTQGIDLRGGVEFVCRLYRDGKNVPADDEVLTILRNRLDERGLTEPQVTRLSNGDVQVVIPGGTTAEAARTRKVLETTGNLEFRKVIAPYIDDPGFERTAIEVFPTDPVPAIVTNERGKDDINPAREDLRRRNRGEIVAPEHVAPGEKPTKWYLLGKPALAGADVKNAYETTSEDGQLAVGIEFTAVGAVRNEEFTRAAKEEQGDAGRPATGTGHIAILFDGEVRSAPVVISPSSSQCQISGSFTKEEIESLRTVLKGGSLAVTPVVLAERVVGATLGEQTVQRTIVLRIAAFLAVALFMWVYYRRLGTVANLCLVATAFFVWSTLSIFNATITLPGFAGLVLIIGMAVDTNILIFERIREELKEDKGLKAAIAAGYDRAFLTIVDSHLTTFVTAFILYWIGTGPVKGFGLTLMIGIVVNLFSGVYIGRLLTDWLCRGKETLSMASWVPALRLPYVEWRWYGYIFSIVTAVGGLAWFMFGHKLQGGSFERNFDIDFTGGNAAHVVFKEPMTPSHIEKAIKEAHDRDRQRFAMLEPDELHKHPYFADLAGNQGSSREWVFRARDEEGSVFETERSALEKNRVELERKIEDIRSERGNQDAEAKRLEQGELREIDAQIRAKTEKIATRTEAFKSQIAGAFEGLVGKDGDEILAAAFDPATNRLTMRLAVLEPIKDDQLAGITDQLASHPRFERVTPGFDAETKALTVEAQLRGAPGNAPAIDLADGVTARLRSLLVPEGTPAAETAARVTAGLDLYNLATASAATRRVTVAKPFPSTEHFSGQVAGQMKVRALAAVILSLAAILAYVAARFEFRFGIGAVVALAHDVLMTVGIISLLKIRIDLSVVAALLTIIGYSINETIVNYDRIRENLRRLNLPLPEVINLSLAQTLARTVLTSGTVVITLIVLLFFGGEALMPFTATLLIGILSGTYSAVFVAAPLLLSFKGRLMDPPAPPSGSEGGDTDAPAPAAPVVPAPAPA